MWRLLHVFAIAALIGSAAYVYGVKYRTIYASEQIVKTRHLIAKEKDAINLLRAEYAHLARPDRVQALADTKLDLQPLALSQIATADELPDARPRSTRSAASSNRSASRPTARPRPVHRLRRDAAGEVRQWPRPARSTAKPNAARAAAPQAHGRPGRRRDRLAQALSAEEFRRRSGAARRAPPRSRPAQATRS